MGLLSNFLILLTMATYRHSIPGSYNYLQDELLCRTQSPMAILTLRFSSQQIALLTPVFIHALDDITLDASGTVSFRCGKTARLWH